MIALGSILTFARANWRWVLPTLGMAVLLSMLAITSAQLKACKAGRVADRQAYTAAQAEATRAALAEKAFTETRQENDRKASDARLSKALGDADTRLADYIKRNRVRPESAQSRADAADLSGTAFASESADGPGDNAVLASAVDLTICTENSVRLNEARQWALSLQEPR